MGFAHRGRKGGQSPPFYEDCFVDLTRVPQLNTGSQIKRGLVHLVRNMAKQAST